MKKKNRVGEKHTTNEGYTIEIINYYGNRKCVIQFQNSDVVKNVSYIQILEGKVKNPFHKSVIGIGFLGVGDYSKLFHSKIYNTWKNMLVRCYNEKELIKHPTYKDITVCEEWHNFQNFAKWFKNNYIGDFELDKDILVKGNNVYSPETCAFVPKDINKTFTKTNAKRGNLPIGVTLSGDKYQSSFIKDNKKVYLGTYCTSEEAFQAYKTSKEQYIKEVADKWRGQITEQVYQAMYNYKVEIDD